MGYFLPLIHYIITENIKNCDIVLRDPHVLRNHVESIPLWKDRNINLSFDDKIKFTNSSTIVFGIDSIPKYGTKIFHEIIDISVSYLRYLYYVPEKEKIKLLIIDRGDSPVWYSTINDNSAKLRRNIENINEIYNKFSKKLNNVKLIQLQNLSLQEQINIFCNTETVFGQHGAGLINIVFNKDIELLEYGLEDRKFFYKLCECRDMKNVVIKNNYKEPQFVTLDFNEVYEHYLKLKRK